MKGLAVDWLRNYLYIAENNRILVCNIEPHFCRTLQIPVIRTISEIVMDPYHGLFWSQHGPRTDPYLSATHIYQAQADGSQPKLILEYLGNIYDLILDPSRKWLIWTGGSKWNKMVESYHLETKEKGYLVSKFTGDFFPYSVALFEDTLYWTNLYNHSIESCDLLEGCNRSLATFIRNPTGAESGPYYVLTAYHRALHNETQFSAGDACLRSSCSHFCFLPSHAGTGFWCACPDHMELDENGSTCRNKAEDQFLLVSTGYRYVK